VYEVEHPKTEVRIAMCGKYTDLWVRAHVGNNRHWLMHLFDPDGSRGHVTLMCQQNIGTAEPGRNGEAQPPERLVHTERWGAEWPETLNTVILTEKDGKTTMTATMLYPSKEARDAALKTGMNDGADVSFDRLAEYLRTMVTQPV